MKVFQLLACVALSATVFLCSSCTKSTADYAKKEDGKKFGEWVLTYSKDNLSNVYWPYLRLYNVSVERVSLGSGIEQSLSENLMITYSTPKNSSSHCNYVYIGTDGRMYDDIRIKFYRGSFSISGVLGKDFYMNEDDLVLYPDFSEKVIRMLSSKHSFSVKIETGYKGYSSICAYTFNLPGTPSLTKAIEILEQRKLLAEKEDKEADKKASKELRSLFN